MALADVLELAKDKPELIEELKKTYDAAGALEKVKGSNADLVRQRDEWVSEKKTLADELKTAKAAGSGATPPEIRALEEKVSALSGKLEASEKKAEAAVQEKQSTDLKNSILASSTNAISPNQVFALMQAEGLVGHADGKPFFHTINAKGEAVSAKPSDAVAAYLKSNPHLVKPSGTAGSGQHNQSGSDLKTGLLKDPSRLL